MPHMPTTWGEHIPHAAAPEGCGGLEPLPAFLVHD